MMILAAGCTGAGVDEDGRKAQSSDTCYTAEKVKEVYSQNPERAMVILDSAEMLGNMSHIDATIIRTRFYSYNESTLDTSRILCTQMLGQGGLSIEQQAEVLDVLVYVARMRGDDEGVLKYGLQYIEACRQLDDETEALLTQSEMGEALIHLGRTDEGLAKIDDAIDRLDKVRNFNEMDVCVRAMKRKIMALIDLNRFDEVIPVAERVLEKMSDYGEHATDYDDSSGRMPADKCRPGYIDFYTSQAYAFMAYAYAMMKDVQTIGRADNQTVRKSENPNIRKSKECLALFEQTAFSKSLNGRKLISSTWCELGKYGEMLAFYDELQSIWGDDTLHSDYAVMLKNRAAAARAGGDYRASDGYMQRYSNMIMTLGDNERMATAQEYAARYHEQEQQMALEKEMAAKRHLRLLVTLLGIIVVLAVAFIVVVLRQMHSIRKKNAALTKAIGERIAYEEEYLHLFNSSQPTVGDVPQNGGKQPQSADPTNEPSDADNDLSSQNLEELNDRELFDYIRKVVSKDDLHLDPQFGRDQLVELLQLSKERVGAAFSQGSDYGNITNFLNDVRLFHSTKLLTEHPEMPIAEVATSSGFTNRVVFSRNFKERFAMTPTEFREKN